jgi:thiol-disulfide isomerase/thioredoxin
MTIELTAAPGHRLHLTSDELELVSNGTTAWIVSPKRKQYIQLGVNADITPQEMATIMPIAPDVVPLTAQILWRAEAPLPMMSRQVTKLLTAAPEAFAGQPGTRVTADALCTDEPDGDVNLLLWFSDKTGLLGGYTIDMTEMTAKKAAMGAPASDDDDKPPFKITKAQYTHTFKNIKLDEPVKDDVFTYTPPADFKKVEEFTEPDPMVLLGRPAPQFSGKLLDDQEFSLDGLKGKVVLLDFWSMGCGPCLAAIPRIQGLATRYADKPVAVIGVSQDKDYKAELTKFLERKKITIRQYMDDGSVSEKYSVNAIPCMVLIDKKVNVPEVKVGLDKGEDEELAKDIDKLLDGKDLRTAEEIAQLQKQSVAPAAAPVDKSP